MTFALPVDDLDMVLSHTPEFWSRYGGARLFMTGGTGFIGSWLLQTIQRANDRLGSQLEVVVLTRSPEAARERASAIYTRSDVTLIQGDVATFTGNFGKFDLCLHAATDVGDAQKASDPVALFNSIVQGTERVIDLAGASGASRFLLTSSGAVYGPQPENVVRVEESYNGAPDPLSLQAAYGNGKRAAEWLLCARASQSGFAACIARIFALIGPGMPLNGPFAAGNFVRDALRGQVIQVQGDGRPVRSYLYMADLCVWLLRLLQSGQPGQAYNVGSQEAVSVKELAQQVAHAEGASLPVTIQTAVAAQTPAPRYLPSTAKAQRELGVAEYTPLATALQKTFAWSRQEAIA